MEGERIGSRAQAATDYDETQPLIRSPSIRVKDYLWKLLGLPNHLDGDYVDSDHNSWSPQTLLCATVFLEDAVHYQSIEHRVTGRYLFIYRCFSSSIVTRLHQIILLINLCLAFFESPSSFSITSDIRDQPHRIEFPYSLLMTIEGLTLCWFLFYISMKMACLGIEHVQKRSWIILFLIVTVYSLGEWFTMCAFFRHTYQGVRLRRILRPIFVIESSQLMKRALRAVHKDALTIIACISLALMHILFFAIMAMFLFPRSDSRPASQGSTYFSSLHDAVFQLLVLSSTANNPDVMIPAYSENRLNVLFFVVFVIIGIYWIQNIVTAVVYRAFRGYFLNSIAHSVLRRRIAVRASFEILRNRLFNEGLSEMKDDIPISVVQVVVNTTSMNQWHLIRIHQQLVDLSGENDSINLDQYSRIMQILDLNPKLAARVEFPTLGLNIFDQLKAVGRSKAFDLIGTVLAILSIILVTIEVSHRHRNSEYKDIETYTLPIAFTNLTLIIYFFLEILLKIWAFGPMNFFRSSFTNILEALVAFSCLILQIIHLMMHGSAVVSLSEIQLAHHERPFIKLWASIKVCNMLFIYRLVRFLPASKNIRIIVGTVIDEIRNGGAFFGVLFSFYYAYSLFGMELFGSATGRLYDRHNQSNVTICGTYEQLEYWPNGFDDFYSSMVTLYNIMVVNQWFVFVNAFRDATSSRWSELYFIVWYIFVTMVGLNICLALSGDIHDAKKKRADQQDELIISNMFDIYRPQLREPPIEEITRRLHQHPYINFFRNPSNPISFA